MNINVKSIGNESLLQNKNELPAMLQFFYSTGVTKIMYCVFMRLV